MSKFYDPHDRNINDVVDLLEHHQIPIIAWGDEYPFRHPTVLIKKQSVHLDEDQIRVAKILSENEYQGYYIKLVYPYQRDPIPWDNTNHTGIEVEFWPPSFLEEIGDGVESRPN